MAYTRPFAYFTGATPSDRVVGIYGNVAVGDPGYNYDDNPDGLKWWMGSDEEIGYIIAEDRTSQTQPTPVSGVTAGVQFWSTELEGGTALTDSAFVRLSNIFQPYRDISGPTIYTPFSAVTWLGSQPYFTSYNLINGSAQFNGTNNLSATLTGFVPGTGSFTYEGYFNATSLTSLRGLWNTRSGDTTDGFDVAITTNGAVVVTWSGEGLMTTIDGLILPKNWYHIAVVRSGSNWTLYVNGYSRATYSSNQNLDSDTLLIGCQTLGTNKFVGNISNFRYSNSAVYTSNFTPSQGYLNPLLASTQFCFNSFVGDLWLVDNSRNYLPITNTGSVANSAFDPFAYIITGSSLKLNLDATNYISYPLTGSTWYDVSGNNNNGTISGTTPYSSGYFTFNGVDSLINQFSSVAGIPISGQSYTVSAWVQIDNKTNLGGIAGWGNYGNNNSVNAFRLTNTGLINYWFGNDYAVNTTLNTGSTWYMLTAQFDGTFRRIYVNSTPISYPGQISTGINVPSATNLTIGKTNTGNVEWFSGKISQVLIYNTDIGFGGVINNYNATSYKYN
jgi:hypothetical protein